MSVDMDLEERCVKKWLSLKESAKVRGKPFSLSINSIRNIYKAKRCYYTKVELTYVGGLDNSVTFDCVDPKKGYVTGNVVACSKKFNEIKGCITFEAVELLYTKLSKRLSK